MILNRQGAAELESWINGGEITPGDEDITLPGRRGLLGDLIIKAVKTENKEVTPGAANQIITPSAGKYLSQVTVAGDADLKPENIAENINIFGILGTIKKGVTGIAFGALTLASSAETVTIAHDLGVVPSFVALIPVSFSTSSSMTSANLNGTAIYYSSSRTRYTTVSNTLTESKVTFEGYYPFRATDYYWIAIA